MNLQKAITIIIMIFFCVTSHCATQGYKYYAKGYEEKGISSFYGYKDGFHGKPTTSGEIFDKNKLTAAHKTIPLGTIAMVRNLDNGKKVKVKINDRGPFVEGRILDLSYKAAKKLDMVEAGTARVSIEILKLPPGADRVPIQREAPIYTVQVGSYKIESYAQRLKEKLDENYNDVYITTGSTVINKYYRVRIGTFKTKDDAEKFAKDLKKDGYKVLVLEKDF